MRHKAMVWTALLVSLAWAGVARAQASGITVTATAEVRAKPTQAEIGATVSGDGELAGDAVVKYRDAKRRAIEAIKALAISDLSVEESGVSLNPQASMNPNNPMGMVMGNGVDATIKGKVQVTERLRVVLKNIDKLEPAALTETLVKALDAMKDAGLVMGEVPTNYYEIQMMMRSGKSGSVQFKLTEPAPLRDKAYAQAMEEARAKAQRLAQLAGGKLGAVMAVSESPAAAAPTENSSNLALAMMGVARGNDAPLTSSAFDAIPVSVTLVVQFALEK